MTNVFNLRTRRPKSFVLGFAVVPAMVIALLLQFLVLAYYPSKTVQVVFLALVLPMMAFGFACNVIYRVQSSRGAYRNLDAAPWMKQPW